MNLGVHTARPKTLRQPPGFVQLAGRDSVEPWHPSTHRELRARRSPALPLAFFLACHRLGVRSTRFMLLVRIAPQQLCVFERAHARHSERRFPIYLLWRRLRCSTSRFGIGQEAGSNGTPLGLHRVAEKLGGGWPVGTVFRGRRPVGFTWKGLPLATITSRILWLEGLEPGFNRGRTVDSRARYIYIHGTGDEPGLGRPASHGCIHLAADDLVPLFAQVPNGTLVWITVA